MRTLWTTKAMREAGISRDQIRRGERRGQWRRITHGVYGAGSKPATPLDVGRATALVTCGVAAGFFAARLHNHEGIPSWRPHIMVPWSSSGARLGVHRVREMPTAVVEVAQVRCLDGLATLTWLAARLDDVHWEQALESALRKGLPAAEIAAWAVGRGAGRARARRVLALRGGSDIPPTESLLETLMVQLARLLPGLPPPLRQVNVYDEYGQFVARVDFAWPELGLFIELDGQQHKGQPVYDADRETAVVAATGWLCGRFTWRQVRHNPAPTARRLARLVMQARLRPLASAGAAK